MVRQQPLEPWVRPQPPGLPQSLPLQGLQLQGLQLPLELVERQRLPGRLPPPQGPRQPLRPQALERYPPAPLRSWAV